MVTTISQAGNCINDPGVPEKCTHRGKKKNPQGLNHAVRSLSAGGTVLNHQGQCAGHGATEDPESHHDRDIFSKKGLCLWTFH